MTDNQRNEIAAYREAGLSYAKIADCMGISVNSIKTYCKRNGLGGRAGKEVRNDMTLCEHCGKPVEQTHGRKHKRFCCDRCRNKWWNAHLDQVDRRANYEIVCQECGVKFISYGNKGRKYCSRICYIKARYGGEE